MDSPHVVEVRILREWMEAILLNLDLPPEAAEAIADVLLDCELRGYEDHGTWFISLMTKSYINSGLNSKPDVKVVRDAPSITLMDGDCGCGVITCKQAMEICIAKAKKTGMAAAGIRNSGNFIAAAPFALQAVEAGMIGFAASNGPAFVPPVGGITRTFSTNPFAYAFPTGGEFPMLLDMSTSATAMAKVAVAAQTGSELASGLAEDSEGRPLTQPQVSDLASCLLSPLGGPKGYGLAMVVDALCGVLTGETFAQDVVMGAAPYGQFLWALDVEQFMPLGEFRTRMSEQIRQIKSGERKEGVEEILVPGERGLRRKRDILADGHVPLSDLAWVRMIEAGTASGVPLPIEVA